MNMIRKNVKYSVLFILGIFLLMSPVFAAINTILPGQTVFIGEQGLDITQAMDGDTQLGWWASGASIGDSSPTSGLISVSSPTSFSISPNIFGSQNGVWYHLNPSGQANGTAFNVVDPQLSIFIDDTTVNVDVTDKWVPTDDSLRFRIDSNLYPIAGRPGQSWTPITIKVQSPDGAVFSSLISNSGVTTSIVDYHVTTSPQYTDSIWGTANRGIYPPGTYTIWAECNVNSMNDNYGVTGKTISRKVSLLNQDQNPLIVNTGYVTNPTTQMTLVPTKESTTIVTPALTTVKTPPPTTIVTTVIPTPTTEVVMPKTTIVTDVPITSPSIPTTTKSSGFEGVLAGLALIAALAFCIKKE